MAARWALSYTEFFEQHYLPYVKLRKRSWNRDEELYRLRIRHVFGNKYLDQITRQQIQAFHTALKAGGLAASTCNHHVKLLKYSLNLAISWEMMEGPNPAAKVPLYHEDNKVAHYLNDAELERLLSVLHSDRNRIVCQIAFLLLSTGCRLNEVLSAKWSDSIWRRKSSWFEPPIANRNGYVLYSSTRAPWKCCIS
ncbi:Site-specific recombinase XerD (fragment) [Nitrosomonas nitrosa]|uniref:Site-specific recombinase XerD n=1 Tax=Nitrosomonas nitrosa TaxID=52442 RepID=A0A8H8YZT2_9PROT